MPSEQELLQRSQHHILADLRNAAALLYPEDSSARVIVDDAGLDARQIAFSSRAESNWHNILAEAIRCNCLAALLNIVCQAYPTNPSLQAAILNYQQFVEAGGQFDVPAQVSPGTTIYGDQTSVGNISQSMAVAIGTGATASVAMTEEVAYSVHGLKNPYIGLSAFNYDDRAKYAGRDAKIREALEKLTEPGKEQTVLFVTGASGSGKSSFVQAGLLPQLREYYEKRHKQVRIATFRPKDQPFANLDDALSQLAPQANRDLATFTPPNQINILVIDQFEEVFTQAHLKVDAEFFQWLQKVPAFPQGRTYIIATIRSDYLNELFNLTKLYDLNRSGVDLRVMTVDELREAIQRPLQVCFPNGERRFEPALVQKLAQEASERSTLLPLLQVALENLWKQGVLRLAAYRKLGDAIQERAEEVYTSRSDPNANNQIKRSEHEQQELMDILLDLIHVAIDNTDRREVRQPRLRQELEKGSLQRRQLIEELVNARLLAIDTEMRNGNVVEIIDIIHESLIDNWNRLKYAIEEKREQLQRRTRFKLWLGEWLRNGRQDEYLLLTAIQLAEVRALAEDRDVEVQNAEAQEFYQKSIEYYEAAQRRRLRNIRMIAAIMASLALISALAAGWGFQNLGNARGSAATAIAALATSDNNLAQKEQERQRADREAANANVARSEAEANAQEAKQQAAFAATRAAEAKVAQAGAEQQALIARSRQLAAQSSVALNKDYQLSLLLAVEAVTNTRSLSTQKHMGNVESALRASLEGQPGGIPLITQQDNTVYRGVFSNDGHWLAGLSDEIVTVWSAGNWQAQPIILASHELTITDLAFSTDSLWLATASADRSVHIWSTQDWLAEPIILSHDGSVNSIVFSSDGRWLASASVDQKVYIWSVDSWDKQSSILSHKANVDGMLFSADGQWLASAGTDNNVYIWSTNDWQAKPIILPNKDRVKWMGFTDKRKS